ncbi:RagB/SusD family nutrient uptake outer membrane protein [Compostibacter hankyongensis]|uniref:RagB/SusD family nutrient uptake outer membrane protein n=1 Tax=Compostibacter hankyongensis TaxID=1007089 RepID=A0ABP8FJW4_9BACT
MYSKHNIYSGATALALFLLLGACKKYEPEPVEFLTKNYVYDKMDRNGDYAKQVLNHLYTYLPNGYNRIDHVVLDAATDDAVSSDNYSTIELLSKSRINAVSTNPDGYWYDGYAAIRDVNQFLAHIDNVPVTAQIKQYWKGEARFIRAMNYFELIKRYGGVPLLGDQLFSQEDEVSLPRSSYGECVQYIVDELDHISDSLREDPVQDLDLGRITRGAALALKSRVLLYAASPLNNPDNDPGKWQQAADAAKAVMDLHVFSLESNYVSLFVKRKNKEVILAYQRAQTTDVERNNAPVGYAEPNQSNGYVSPTQELVDAFPMRNGLPVDDAASGYDPANPYASRDPRLGATVFYNGAAWLSRPVETFEGGLDKPNLIQRQTRTGYYMRKFLADYSGSTAYGNQDHNFPIFRYAGILLNYAEAANELGDQDAAYEQLKAIRKRAGIDPGADEMYGLKAGMTQEEMRKAVRLERRIEMAFEEQRFWDIRRWKIAGDVADGTLHGMKIEKNADGSFTYQTVGISDILFTAPKMYLYPIPYEEIAGNPAVTQNPGWE